MTDKLSPGLLPWWEQAIRNHEAEYGPGGDNWNISSILDALRRASPAPTGGVVTDDRERQLQERGGMTEEMADCYGVPSSAMHSLSASGDVERVAEKLRRGKETWSLNPAFVEVIDEAIAALTASRNSGAVSDDLERRYAQIYEQLVETQMRAWKWMEAHDKLQAGKPYEFPKPADLPDALERIAKLEDLVRFGLAMVAGREWGDVFAEFEERAKALLNEGGGRD